MEDIETVSFVVYTLSGFVLFLDAMKWRDRCQVLFCFISRRDEAERQKMLQEVEEKLQTDKTATNRVLDLIEEDKEKRRRRSLLVNATKKPAPKPTQKRKQSLEMDPSECTIQVLIIQLSCDLMSPS